MWMLCSCKVLDVAKWLQYQYRCQTYVTRHIHQRFMKYRHSIDSVEIKWLQMHNKTFLHLAVLMDNTVKCSTKQHCRNADAGCLQEFTQEVTVVITCVHCWSLTTRLYTITFIPLHCTKLQGFITVQYITVLTNTVNVQLLGKRLQKAHT